MGRYLAFGTLALAAVLAACSSTLNTSGAVPVTAPSTGFGPGNYIKHIVVIVQENRSFDNLFDCFPGEECITTAPMATTDPQGKPVVLTVKLSLITSTTATPPIRSNTTCVVTSITIGRQQS